MLKLLLPLIGWGYIRFVAATSRIIPHGEKIVSQLKQEGKVFIYTFWHGRQIFLPYVRRMDTLDALISESKDGEYIARTIRFFGMDSVRGSTSKGSRRALVQLTRSLKGGKLVALTPDGPMGPKHKVKPGIIFIAKKMGVPIVPLAFAAKRKKIFYGWDEFHVPYPFNRIAVTYGEPYYVSKTVSNESAAQELEKRLNDTTKLADKIAMTGA